MDDLQLSYVLLHETAQEKGSGLIPFFCLNSLSIENLAYKTAQGKSYLCPFKIEGSLFAKETLYFTLILTSPQQQNHYLLAEIKKDKGVVQCLRNDQSALTCVYTYDGTNYLALLKGCSHLGTFNSYLKCSDEFELIPSLFTCNIYKSERNDSIDLKGTICGKLFDPEIEIQGMCPSLIFLDINYSYKPKKISLSI